MGRKSGLQGRTERGISLLTELVGGLGRNSDSRLQYEINIGDSCLGFRSTDYWPALTDTNGVMFRVNHMSSIAVGCTATVGGVRR